MLDRAHRFGSAIAGVAEAIRRGDGDAVVAALEGGDGRRVDPRRRRAARRERRRRGARRRRRRARRATPARRSRRWARSGSCARTGAGRTASPPGRHASRHGSRRTSTGLEGEWYAGRPLLATANDYGIGLFNGDTGVVVAREGLVAAFERGGRVLEIAPSRLSAVETVFAMTVHKSQGSQFDTAAVVLPPPSSRLLTRELLYTAVTRARTRLIVAGTEEAIRAAVARPVARASGLGARLWAPTLEGA